MSDYILDELLSLEKAILKSFGEVAIKRKLHSNDIENALYALKKVDERIEPYKVKKKNK